MSNVEIDVIYGKDLYVIYGGANCMWCEQAKKLLETNNEEYLYFDVREDGDALAFLQSEGYSSIPQIYMSGEHIGGFNELKEKIKNDK